MILFIKSHKYKEDMGNSKTRQGTKILCSSNFKSGIFEIFHLENFNFVPYKRRFIAASNKLVFSGLKDFLITVIS